MFGCLQKDKIAASVNNYIKLLLSFASLNLILLITIY